MGSKAEWKGQSKETPNSKIEQKLPTLNNKDKIGWKQNKTKQKN